MMRHGNGIIYRNTDVSAICCARHSSVANRFQRFCYPKSQNRNSAPGEKNKRERESDSVIFPATGPCGCGLASLQLCPCGSTLQRQNTYSYLPSWSSYSRVLDVRGTTVYRTVCVLFGLQDVDTTPYDFRRLDR
jgi:hypothetical protein